MERKDGFLMIDDYKELPFDNCIFRGKYASCWLQDKATYLFKCYPNILSCYKELVYSRLATKIGINNVGYDLASFHGGIGVITKRCTSNVPMSLKIFLLEYLKEHFGISGDDEMMLSYIISYG